jgi:hypothetical protein
VSGQLPRETPPAPPTIDAAAVVAEVAAEVARRRAAGEYPQALIDRISAEFMVEPADDAPEPLAVIEASRPLRSHHPIVGPAIVFAKRVVRRLLTWYVSPIADDQTRFNLALLREFRALERHVGRVETPWPGGSHRDLNPQPEATGDAALAAIRVQLYGDRLPRAIEGRTLVVGGGAELIEALRASGAAPEAAPSDVFDLLDRAGQPSWTSVVVAGLLPRLSASETLQLIPAAALSLRPGGLLVVDAPLPGDGPMAHPAGVNPANVRWVPPETVVFLCEAAGLTDVDTLSFVASALPWYAVVARRPEP